MLIIVSFIYNWRCLVYVSKTFYHVKDKLVIKTPPDTHCQSVVTSKKAQTISYEYRLAGKSLYYLEEGVGLFLSYILKSFVDF